LPPAGSESLARQLYRLLGAGELEHPHDRDAPVLAEDDLGRGEADLGVALGVEEVGERKWASRRSWPVARLATRTMPSGRTSSSFGAGDYRSLDVGEAAVDKREELRQVGDAERDGRVDRIDDPGRLLGDDPGNRVRE
jgi:hypothetical protein